jgi:hypothetical protein
MMKKDVEMVTRFFDMVSVTNSTAQLHDFNTMFQTSDPVLHVVISCDPFTVSLDHPNLRVPTDQVYLGIQATTTLQELIAHNPEAVQSCQDVRGNCLEFMLEAVRQIRLRFDLQDSAHTPA